MIRSIRVRITLWHTCIFALILCLFAGALYFKVASNLYREVDEVLLSQAGGVADAIFAFWRAEHEFEPTTSGESFPHLIRTEIKMGVFNGLMERWAKEIHETHPLRILGPDGAVIYSSVFFPAAGAPSPASIQNASSQLATYETLNRTALRVRIVTLPVIEDDIFLYAVQTAVLLNQADRSLLKLRNWLMTLIPLTILVLSVVGWSIISAALRPVDAMIEKAKSISVHRLHSRIDLPGSNDELERLASTFNGMMERIERSFKRLRQFSAAASHELRTPLSIMKGEIEVTLRKKREAGDYERALRALLELVTELEGIVSQFLTLAYSEEGEEKFEWQPVELGELVAKSMNLACKAAQMHGITIEYIKREEAWMRGERRLLERLISNLLENALKHTPQGGRIQVTTSANKEEAILCVKDSGVGIPAAQLEGVFDRFFDKSPLERNSTQGVGLGLGLCRWIAEAHSGHIEASNAPAEGARFTVSFPIARPENISGR